MNLQLTEDQELMRETARRFLQSEMPLSRIRSEFDSADGFDREWWVRASQLGWTMLHVPEVLGGVALSGYPAQDLAVVAEEMGRQVAPGPFQASALALLALGACENASDFVSMIGGAMSGDAIIGWAFGEPGNAWEPTDFKTQFTWDGDALLLSGEKAYVEAGAVAHQCVVTGRLNGLLVQALVPVNAPGVTVVAYRSLDAVRRFAMLRFDRVRVSVSALLQFTGGAEREIERQLQLALLIQCAETNGALDKAMEFTMAYMQERYAFGRSIASYQALKHRLADMYLQLHSCMAISDAALKAFDTSSVETRMLARVAKAYVGAKSTEIMSDLVQMTGGIAVTWEHDLHLYSRRVALNRAIYGTPELYRYQVQMALVQNALA